MYDIIIGDEHGRGKFLKIYEQFKNDQNVRYFICVGDYFDPYEFYSIEDLLANFNVIKSLAKEDKRIKLLFGNHDIHYLIESDHSRMDGFNKENIKNAFLEDFDLFSLVIKLDDYTIVSHAGVTQDWMNKCDFGTVEDINSILNKNDLSLLRCLCYDDRDFSGYGEAPYQSCVWVRPNGLTENSLIGIKEQIVGHTGTESLYHFGLSDGMFGISSTEPVEYNNKGCKFVFVDTKDYINFYKREVINE